MKKHFPFLLAVILLLSGCLKQEDLDAHAEQLNDEINALEAKLSTLERYTSYFEEPVEFEIHDLSSEDQDITAAIRSNDPRIKGKSIYIDAIIDIYSGKTKVGDSPVFIYLNDGIGKIETSYWLSSDEKKLTDPSKVMRFEFRMAGWNEMFPGTIIQK